MFRKKRAKELDKFWAGLSLDPKVKSGTLATLLDQVRTEQLPGLAELMVEQEQKQGFWLKRYWLEALLAVALAGTVALATWNMSWLTGGPARSRVVIAEKDLPAFHKVDKAEVGLGPRAREGSGFSDPAEVVNRYTIAPVKSGSAMQQQQLAPEDWGSQDARLAWRVMTVQVKTAPAFTGKFDLPGRATLLLAPRSEKMAPELFQTILLQCPVGGDLKSALVAIKEEDLKRFAGAAGQSDFFLLREVR